jgi:Ca2+-binding RTX toxin-like protein
MFRTVSNGAYAPTTPSRVDAGYDQRDVAFARLPGDGYVAVWFDGNDPGTIRAQRFDGDGRKVGAEVEVWHGRGQASVAATDDGGFLVAWKGSDGSPTGIQTRLFDAAGNPLGFPITISTTNNGFLSMPEVTALENGGFVVVWKQQDNVTAPVEVYAQILNAAGAMLIDEMQVALNASYYPGVDVVGLAGGGFAITWTEPESGADFYGGNSTVRAQVYSANGGLASHPIYANDILPGGQANSQLLALPDGGFYAVWTDDGGRHKRVTTFNGNEGVYLQRFDARGREVGDEIRTGATGFLPDMPTLALTETGGVFATWSERYGNQFSFSRLKGQFFDLQGSAQGAAFELGNEVATAEYGTSALLLGNGSIVLGWNEAYYGALALQSQLLVPAEAGTAAGDSFAGTAGRDYYAAGGGDDIVAGGAEADGLAGEDGDDRLVGEAGDDLLYGGAGQDDLAGGEGNDLLDGGSGADAMAGGAGDDLFYFGAALSAGDVADGGAGRDAVVLQGNFAAVLSDTNLIDIESISIQSGAATRWGDTANNFYDYALTTADGNVPAGVQLIVNAQSLRVGEDFSFDGSAETDGRFLVYGGHGVDNLTGGDGVDAFFFEGRRWGPDDRVDGGDGRDALVISGGSGITRIEFAPDALTSIESISLNNRFATDPTQKPSYDLVLNNGNVAAGGTLIVNGSTVPGGQQVNIDGRGVHDGNLILFAGGGHDTLLGGDGADLIVGGGGSDSLTGGAGADTFRYDAASDSIGLADLIGDFQSGLDRIDLSRIDANANSDGNQAFVWIGSNAFSGSAGELRTYEADGYRLVEGDTDGNGFADFVIGFQVGTSPLVQGDFLL